MTEVFKPGEHGIEAIDLELTLGRREKISVSRFVYPEAWDDPVSLELVIEHLIHQTIHALQTKGYVRVRD